MGGGGAYVEMPFPPSDISNNEACLQIIFYPV